MGKLRDRRRRRPSKTVTGLNRSATAGKMAGQTSGYNNPIVGEIGQGEIIEVILAADEVPVVTQLPPRRTGAYLIDLDPYGGGDIADPATAHPIVSWTRRGDNLVAWGNSIACTLQFWVF